MLSPLAQVYLIAAARGRVVLDAEQEQEKDPAPP